MDEAPGERFGEAAGAGAGATRGWEYCGDPVSGMLPVWPLGGVDGRAICWLFWFCASNSCGTVYCASSPVAVIESSGGGLLCPVLAVSGSD